MNFLDLFPESNSFLEDVLMGLSRAQKKIPPKYFYDKRGSELFEAICELEEYYPTRTELKILETHVDEMSAYMNKKCHLFEFGSGSSLKTKILLSKMKGELKYYPVDISKKFLVESADSLKREFPHLHILPVCADFTKDIDIPPMATDDEGERFVFFPGSTIGNFEPKEALEFLKTTSQFLGTGGKLLIGVDLRKNPRILEAAYNDSRGVTAEFNLNLLKRINAELAGDFDLPSFQHSAVFNPVESRIEMHLISKKDQDVTIAGKKFNFTEGETIHTECSYKYTPERFERMAHKAGFSLIEKWTDSNGYFAVYMLESEGLAETYMRFPNAGYAALETHITLH